MSTPRRPSLARRLATLVSLALLAIWLVSVTSMGLVLRGEQEELYDQQLVASAEAFLPVLSGSVGTGANPIAGAAPTHEADPEEALVYRLVDRSGTVLLSSPLAGIARFPDRLQPDSYQRTETHVVYTSGFNASGHAVQFGDPLAERREAWRESFFAFLLPMLMILPLGYLLVCWITKLALRPLGDVREEMAARGSHDLSPIDASGRPAELADMIATLNGFMARLSQALDGERAFASNAAHELRTPVAVALAQVQRLEANAGTPEDGQRLRALHTALLRMSRLVARLLQLARADSGIGPGDASVDAVRLLPHILRDAGLEAGERLKLTLPETPVMVPVDADAFAIIVGNLVDNALQHSPPASQVDVALSENGLLRVTNAGQPVTKDMLQQLTRRFARRESGGFGLGLHIASQIARQAGVTLDFRSPAPDQIDGFEARLQLL